jgi:hypothetical protein
MPMFNIPTEPQKWSADEAAALRQYLNTPAGQATLRQLYQLRPLLPFVPANMPFDAARRASEADQLVGYEKCIQDLVALTASPN